MNNFNQLTRFAVFATISIVGIHFAFYFVKQDQTLMALLPIGAVLACAFYYLKKYTEIDNGE